MKRIVCEMCGGTDLVKQDGLFVCQSCGSKYSVEEARKMMVEFDGPVEVTGTVQVDNSGKFDHYKQMAINAYNSGAYADAEKYFNAAMEINLDDWQCILYKGLAAARQSTLANPRLNEVGGAAQIAYQLVRDDFDLRYKVASELHSIAEDYHQLAWRHYKKFESVAGALGEYKQHLVRSASVMSVALDFIKLDDSEMKDKSCRESAFIIATCVTNYLRQYCTSQDFSPTTFAAIEKGLGIIFSIKRFTKDEKEREKKKRIEEERKAMSEREASDEVYAQYLREYPIIKEKHNIDDKIEQLEKSKPELKEGGGCVLSSGIGLIVMALFLNAAFQGDFPAFILLLEFFIGGLCTWLGFTYLKDHKEASEKIEVIDKELRELRAELKDVPSFAVWKKSKGL